MSSSIFTPSAHTILKPNQYPLLPIDSPLTKRVSFSRSRAFSNTARASLSATKETVLKDFHQRRALKIISGLHNLDRDNVAAVVTAADKGGATHVDIACDPDLVKLATSLTALPVCVSSVDPAAFPAAVEAGALMVEIGNYDSFYEMGVTFSPEQIINLTKETRRILPHVALSVTVPHTLSLPDQVKLAEQLEQEGVDIIQTEGGKCSNPSKAGVLGLIEKATPTLAAAYSIARAVRIPVMCSSGLSSVTAPMAITAGASGVGVGSAVNKLNDVVAMIAEVKSISESFAISTRERSKIWRARARARAHMLKSETHRGCLANELGLTRFLGWPEKTGLAYKLVARQIQVQFGPAGQDLFGPPIANSILRLNIDSTQSDFCHSPGPTFLPTRR
ncbi:uncharacterized protein ycf23 [Phtheirospermum japonicum]|uniref:Uncharacterized protein ycf23 n=1 Tax=Phtheirospermum japonicum TaxID=374723 RepID=A0A830C2M9_9LAMI|nr:uncharacterized protein ycf23 [Phtheirospermum japonicum]